MVLSDQKSVIRSMVDIVMREITEDSLYFAKGLILDFVRTQVSGRENPVADERGRGNLS